MAEPALQDVHTASTASSADEAPGSLLGQIMQETKLREHDEGYDVAQHGITELLKTLLQPEHASMRNRVDSRTLDTLIAEIDTRLGQQLDVILHNTEFQQLESAWRGLKFVVDRTDFRENIQLELLNVSQQQLLDDFQDATDITRSGLYKHVYTSAYGQFGGEPITAMIANYELGPGTQDIELLDYVARVGAMAHTPFMASAGPQFFGLDDFQNFPNLQDLKAILEGPRYNKWRALRDKPDARYLGLTVPRFLLRLPYDKKNNPIRAFVYDEQVSGSHEDYLWGNTAFAFATRLTESFARYRLCQSIIGPQSGGAVEDLPLHQFQSMGQLETKIPTEVLISDRRDYELAEEGFIALTMRKGSDNACFFAANSVQKPRFFGNSPEGKEAETNYKLGTQFPYLFLINRLAHYLKVIQRENLGSFKERTDLERELNQWIRQYVVDQENPSVAVRERRPLRQAQITVESVEGDPGWYRVNMRVRPHFKYMGAYFTLSLVGKIEVPL